MPEIINGFEYDEEVLSALKTARQNEQTNKDLRAGGEASVVGHGGYSAWMTSLRAATFFNHSVLQKQEIHGVAFILNGRLVCTCGLIAGSSECDDRDEALWNSHGHIHTPTREPVSLFVVEVYVSKKLSRQHHYWCVNCGDVGNTIPAADGSVSALGLKAIRASHFCQVSK